jgi:hypothetical protein
VSLMFGKAEGWINPATSTASLLQRAQTWRRPWRMMDFGLWQNFLSPVCGAHRSVVYWHRLMPSRRVTQLQLANPKFRRLSIALHDPGTDLWHCFRAVGFAID